MPRPVAAAKPLRFLSPLHRATRQIAIHLQTRTAGLGLSTTEGHVLTYVDRYGPCPPGELSRVFGMSKSTLTGVLDRLAAEGLVERTLNAKDRRSFLVTTTAKGRRAGAALRKILEALEREIAAHLRPSEVAGFERVMAAIGEVTRVEVRPNEASDHVTKEE
jgi:DNA-binding MarR family transcriptional regulator